MSITDLFFKKQHLQVGLKSPTTSFPLPALVEFDASVSEIHTDEAEATEFPVEEGSNITDHIRKKPSVITVDGLISNTPIIYLATAQAKSPVIGDLERTLDRVETANAKLQELQDAGVLIDVITGLKSYQNMALIGKTVFRDAQNGNVLRVSLILREIRIASALSVDLPVPENVANKKADNEGTKAPKEADSAVTEKSSSLLGELAGLF